MPTRKPTSPKLKTVIRTDKETFGGEVYTVSVDVTNSSDAVIDDISVTPQVIPGIPLEIRQGPENIELEELEAKKRQIVREMETQISLAYERKVLRELSPYERIVALAARSVGTILPFLPAPHMFTRLIGDLAEEVSVLSVPVWARQALRIEDWADIERIEQEVISYEEQDSFLRKAFLLNRVKLRELIDKLDRMKADKEKTQDDLKDVYSIQPTETISFPFKARAPLVFRTKDYAIQFLISYKDQQLRKAGTFSASQDIRFYPSSAVVSLGVLLGAIGGFLVKVSMVSQQEWFTPTFGGNLIGTIVLALAIAFITVRTPDSKKPITADNFIGGFILGVLAGIFSESIIERLRVLVANL